MNSQSTTAILRDVVETIEKLRLRRQKQAKDQPHPLLRRFSQQELTDEVCPTYKNWLVGRSRRIPSREMIVQIALYLECSALERNELFLSARYLPETPELEGHALSRALGQAQRMLDVLPYPAMLVTHRLQIEAFNDAFQCLFDFPPLAAIPSEQRHLFHFSFQHSLPLRARSTFDQRALRVWEAGVARSIHLFRESNVLYQFEPWYRALIQGLCATTDFRAYWERDEKDPEQDYSESKRVLVQHRTTGQRLPIPLRHVRLSASSHLYPCIMALEPVDEAAQAVMASLGPRPISDLNALRL